MLHSAVFCVSLFSLRMAAVQDNKSNLEKRFCKPEGGENILNANNFAKVRITSYNSSQPGNFASQRAHKTQNFSHTTFVNNLAVCGRNEFSTVHLLSIMYRKGAQKKHVTLIFFSRPHPP